MLGLPGKRVSYGISSNRDTEFRTASARPKVPIRPKPKYRLAEVVVCDAERASLAWP